MNRNQIIGTIIGKLLGFAVQGLLYGGAAAMINPENVVVIQAGTRFGLKYSLKFFRYTSKNLVRTDYSSETILSDVIDASFSAY